jgi:hypothetical protein
MTRVYWELLSSSHVECDLADLVASYPLGAFPKGEVAGV